MTSAEFMQSPRNEPILNYKPGSEERRLLDQTLERYSRRTQTVPIVIGDQEYQTEEVCYQYMPFDHQTKVAKFSHAPKDLIQKAVDVAMSAREQWERRPLRERADILLRAADLAATKYRMDLNAATILGQGKTIVQAEIDAACELVDFFRFNAYFALELEKYQPISTKLSTNRMIYRGLEGFVAAVSPFNFTAIGGNLASCPALMGNVVLWKPSDTAVLANYVSYQILREAGVPPGVINFIPSSGPVFGDAVTNSPHLAAINFTGSVPTFRRLWKQVADNIERYITFPRLVGECGGKNFHFVHPSADIDTVAACTARAAFEYQGQKCSACSRIYVPEGMWSQLKPKLLNITEQMKMDSPVEKGTFLTAVIDRPSFDRIKGYIEYAKKQPHTKIISGGTCDASKGYFVEPTIIECSDPTDKLMTEEIFGPVLTVNVYPDGNWDKVLKSVKEDTPFGLTGAIFGQDKSFVQKASTLLRDAAGNFYINDKCTGAVVGQQPFGGARLSGTNDKAGGPHYVLKWASPQVIKETSAPLHEWRYPSMD